MGESAGDREAEKDRRTDIREQTRKVKSQSLSGNCSFLKIYFFYWLADKSNYCLISIAVSLAGISGCYGQLISKCFACQQGKSLVPMAAAMAVCVYVHVHVCWDESVSEKAQTR